MKLSKSFDYQIEKSNVRIYSHILIGSIMFFCSVLLFTGKTILIPVILLLVILEIVNLNKSHGKIILEVFSSENIVLKIFNNHGDLLVQQKIQTLNFSWNYEHLLYYGEGSAGRTSSSHSNILQLKIEMTDINEERTIIIQELYPWQSLPNGWAYKVKDEDYDQEYRIKKGIRKFKERIEDSKNL